jgi:polyisoprenoid-binding protein YceI
MIKTASALCLALVTTTLFAAPAVYTIDSTHTYPSFEADHAGGMSVWRGKFNSTKGTITFDRAAHSGEVDITVDAASINFGNDRLNEHAKGADLFDVTKFPTATYTGKISKFNGDVPTEVQGELTLHGVTKPVTLTINSFLCRVNPMSKKEVCGADASTTFNRYDFGVSFGQTMGFKGEVKLAIEVEAIKTE